MERRNTRKRVGSLTAIALLAGLALAAALAACGGGAEPTPTAAVTVTSSASPTASPTSSPSASPTTAATTTVSVYFLRGEKLGVAERHVPRTRAVATAAMRELCKGPTASEKQAGLGTTVPTGTKLRSVSLKNGVARVDLTSTFAGGGGALSMTARIAQVVYTLTQFPTIKSVTFSLDGTSITSLGGEGVAVDTPQRRADWVGFEPPIFVESPGVGAVVSSPFVLRGTASVFEASFLAEVRDSSDKRLARLIMTASEGAPGRGTFRKAIRFTTSAASGTLIVWHVSMEDGSRMDEVRIPVTIAQ